MRLFTLILLSGLAFGQAVPTPTPKQQFLDNSGRILSGGKLYSYMAGTSTPLATYTDATASVANSNPVTLDASGRAGVWLGSAAYKLVLTTSAGVTIWSVDQVPGNTSAAYLSSSGGTISGNLIITGNISASNLILTGSCTGCGGGGSGSPGGADTQIQYNNSGAFAGSANMTWDNTNKLLSITAVDAVHAGIAVGTGFIQSDTGFYATIGTALNFNAIQAPGGGMYAKSFTALNYIQTGSHSGVPTITAGDTFNAGAMYWDTGTSSEKVYNGSAWISLGGGSGSPGGSNTQVQFNSSGAFGGSANLTYASQLLTSTAIDATHAGIAVATGFMQADTGFYATTGTATKWNSFYAPTGGIGALSGTFVNYVQVGALAADPSVTTGDTFHPGATYYNTVNDCLTVRKNSGTFTCVAGGSGTPGGSNTSLQFNNSGAFGGSPNLTWNNGSNLLNVTTASSGVAGINVSSGFVQSDGGFLVSPSNTSTGSIQTTNGGVTAKWLISTDSLIFVQESAPPLSAVGQSRIYMDNSTYTLLISQNGGAYGPFGAGAGVSSLNGTLTGAVVINGTANEIIVTPGGSSLTLSLPQTICTACNVQFANVNTGAVSAANGGTSATFQNANSNFIVNGNGAVTIAGVLQSASGVNVVTASNYNAIQVSTGNGGMAARSFTSSSYVQVGQNFGPPGMTPGDSPHPGLLYWDTSGTPCLRAFDGSAYNCVGGGSGASLSANNTWTGIQTWTSSGTHVMNGQLNVISAFSSTGFVASSSGLAFATNSIGSATVLLNGPAGTISFTGGISANGHNGITGSTCSHWTMGICDTP